MDLPDFSFETEARARGFLRIAGIDEVGRGPLAGPVTAAAVILDPLRLPKGLRDSKTLTKVALPRIAAEIHDKAQVAIAHASVEEIDALNILQAALLAMRRAVEALGVDHVLVDGKFLPKGLTGQALVKGDARCLSIAAASIVAKVERDRIMVDLAQQYPGYGWEKNAGYPSPAHKKALLDLGVTPCHRRSFKPIHNILYQEHSASA